MEYEIRVNLSHLMDLLGEDRGKRVTVAELARAAGVERGTLYRYISGTIQRPQLSTLANIVKFFSRQGMPIGIEDLLIYDEDGWE